MTDSQRPSDYPRWLRVIVRWLFGLVGWHAEGAAPNAPKFVVVGAPHTSNWDGLVMVGISIILGVKMYWLGKHTLFKPPLGWLSYWLNGVPVNRELTKNAVEQAIDIFNAREDFVLVVAPEGTRKKVDVWKTGFYYIALGANVPMVLGYLDYPRKRCGLGPAIMPTGDIDADFEHIRAFYADKVGRHPERQGTIALSPRR
jgi:1-acyl-sn-glycerol-3-phosphate acyltransferase